MGEPFLEGLVEAFYLAARLRVVGAAVAEADAAAVQGDFEGDSAGAAVAAGEDSPVVAEQAGRIAIGANGSPKLVLTSRALNTGRVSLPGTAGSGRRRG